VTNYYGPPTRFPDPNNGSDPAGYFPTAGVNYSDWAGYRPPAGYVSPSAGSKPMSSVVKGVVNGSPGRHGRTPVARNRIQVRQSRIEATMSCAASSWM
jgi:hypothetical protein